MTKACVGRQYGYWEQLFLSSAGTVDKTMWLLAEHCSYWSTLSLSSFMYSLITVTTPQFSGNGRKTIWKSATLRPWHWRREWSIGLHQISEDQLRYCLQTGKRAFPAKWIGSCLKGVCHDDDHCLPLGCCSGLKCAQRRKAAFLTKSLLHIIIHNTETPVFQPNLPYIIVLLFTLSLYCSN